ncbi:MAG: nucleoside monophosphate kinase [Snowella sp.]|nr:nucleoside monophosphate kinase [Snowella sp.]
MRLVMLGGPGAGKGTQSKNLSQSLGLPIISMGDILRAAIAAQTPLGIQAEPYVTKGELLPDFMMIQFIRQRLQQPDIQIGWILDGYPRTAFQAEELDFLLEELAQPLDWAIYLEIRVETMLKRSLARSLFDDQPPVIQKRIEQFQQRTIPILEYYQGKKNLLNISAESVAEIVSEKLLVALNHLA